MKSAAAAVVISALAATAAHASQSSPIGKVQQLLSDLQLKIAADGERAERAYGEFVGFCDGRSRELGFEIKTGKGEVAKLEAGIAHETARVESLVAKSEELTASYARDEADLKQATALRAKEATAFSATDKELTETIDVLQRAMGILEREMQKGGAALVQAQGAGSIVGALAALVDASAIGAADGARLSALLQSSGTGDQDEDAEPGAPSAAAYESHSGGIMDTLGGLLEKADVQLAAARTTETKARHSFELIDQALKDSIADAMKDLAEAKTGMAEASERKAKAQGSLAVTARDLKADEASLEELRGECVARAEDHEAAAKSRDEELKALAEAKQAIEEATDGADRVAYGAASLLQLQGSGPSPSLAAARIVRDLSRRLHSPALVQLASRLFTAAHADAPDSEDPYAKVKGLITDMIARLEEEAATEAAHKAFCDRELAAAGAKEADKKQEIEKVTAKTDQMSARAAQLKEEVAAVQKGLAELAASQAEMDKMRQAERAAYAKDSADLEQGLQGVKLALKILREYYTQDGKAHAAAEGAAAGIIGLLEVVESDLSKSLVQMKSAEETAQAAYEAETKDNEIEGAANTKDVEYKTKEATQLSETVGDATSDRTSVQAELHAVSESISHLKKLCDVVPETYAGRRARREAELAGLREALAALEGEAVLLQRGSGRALRGPRQHSLAA